MAVDDSRVPFVRLLAGWPLRPTPGFLLRNLRLWARLLRRGLQAQLYRGRERLN